MKKSASNKDGENKLVSIGILVSRKTRVFRERRREVFELFRSWKRKKEDRAPPFARTRVCALLRVKNILSRNILADRVTGGLPQESSERASLSIAPLPSPPCNCDTLVRPSFLRSFLPFLSSFLPFFQPFPLPPNKNRIKMRDLLKRLILRVGQPSRAMPRMSFWTQWREGRKENRSLVTRSSANSRSYLDDAKRIASSTHNSRYIYIYFILKQTLKANDFVFDLNELLLLLLLFFDCI